MAKQDMTYGEAIAQIEAILEKFNDEQFDIDALAVQVKRATELIKMCRCKLRKAEGEVAKVLDQADGK
ncbi:MAG: exodeoxyribonuclease VII small subunit [Alistipes sp.]|nr:exodeoxyribonuclease VII small subunit [Alistipes sp.]